MKDENRTRDELMNEVLELRQRVSELETLETERKRIEEEFARHTKQVEMLYHVAQTMSQTLNLEELLDSALEKVLEVMDIEAGGILLLAEQTNELVLRAHRGLSAEFVQGVKGLRVGEGFAGQVAQSGKPLLVKNLPDDPKLTRMVAKREGLQSLAAIPVMAKERILGVMSVVSYGYREFSDREVRMLSIIANQIGVAIENAQLHEHALELAFTDGLTGLYNRRYLMEQIEREFAHAQRSEAPLSLIMIDLDGLKEINDCFGHHGGDAALKELGRIIKGNTRASDIAARWAGDEFMLLTPEADSSSARRIAKRIRAQVEQCLIKIDGREVGITISVGIASYPAHALGVSELLQKADEAMYNAKKGGKNQLRVLSP